MQWKLWLRINSKYCATNNWKRERRKFLFTTRWKTHIKYMRKQRKTSRFCYINNILPCLVQRTCQFYSKSKKQNIFIQNVYSYFWFHVTKSLFPSNKYVINLQKIATEIKKITMTMNTSICNQEFQIMAFITLSVFLFLSK